MSVYDEDAESVMVEENGPVNQLVDQKLPMDDWEEEEDEPPKKKGWMAKSWLLAQEMGLVKVTVWCVLTVVMTVIGGWLFAAIEAPNNELVRTKELYKEQEYLRKREQYIEHFVKSMMTLESNGSVTTETKPKAIRDLIEEYEKSMNISVSDPELARDPWTFLNSMFFSCSLYTTIGFGGRNFPMTTSGRICTMIYSFIGVPFMFTMTSDLGLVIFEGIYWVWFRVMSIKRSKKAAEMQAHSQAVQPVVDPEPETHPAKPAKKKKIDTSENIALQKQKEATFPVSLGLLMSVISLLFCSLVAQLYEPSWSFFDANYYYVTSFLTIGLGDIQPTAPEKTSEATLVPHIILLIFSMTFIGLSSHVLSKRIELSYAMLAHAIHMEFRTRQVDPAITPMKDRDNPVSESAQIDNLARKLGFFDRFYYGAMDNSRKRLLLEMWHRKANMKNKEIQVNLPRRDIGCQHLLEVDDITALGDWETTDFGLPKKIPEPENPYLKYLYNLD